MNIMQQLILYLAVMFFATQFYSINANTFTPNQIVNNPYYFGTHYLQFNFETDNFFQKYTNAVTAYQYTRPLNKIYRNISHCLIILSQFKSTVNFYVGFTVQISYISDPTSNVNVKFSILPQSSFSRIGFTVIFITKPFDTIIIPKCFNNIYQRDSSQSWSTSVKSTSKFYPFIVSLNGKTSGSYLTVRIQDLEVDTDDNQIQFDINVSPDSDDINYWVRVSYLILLIHPHLIPSTAQLSLVSFNIHFKTPYVFSTPSPNNFNIDTTKYGVDFRGKCMTGFASIQKLNKNTPYFLYDLTQKGAQNGSQNSLSGLFNITSLCFRDLQCPSSYPFKSPNSIYCHDCSDGIIISGTQTIPNCKIQNPLMKKFNYNTTQNQIISRCTNCVDCIDNTHYLQNGQCKLCSQMFIGCLQCNQTRNCFDCNISYYAWFGDCLPCSDMYGPCIYCDQLNQCTLCQPNHFWNSSLMVRKCQPCNVLGCQICINTTACSQCIPNFQLSAQNLCIYPHCTSVVQVNGEFICVICNKTQKYFLQNKKCVCRSGYKVNNVTEYCEQICGDGLTYQLSCDDGNLNEQDGCNNKCQILPDFECKIILKKTYCKAKIRLQLQITQIFKLKNNSAIISINSLNTFFPFAFQDSDFKPDSNGQIFAYINVILSKNPLTNVTLKSQILSSNGRQIKMLVMYDFDIQGYPAQITLNTSNTLYICDNNQAKLQFMLKGSNGVLRIQKFQELYSTIQYGMLINTIFTNIILIIGLLSSKYIGLEGILTLQLIYFSQLLIEPVDKWPVGFQSLVYLKYSNGYNQFFNFIQVNPLTSIQRKYSLMEIKKSVIQNFNLSFTMLILSFIVFVIAIFYDQMNNKKRKQKKKKLIKQKLLKNNQISSEELKKMGPNNNLTNATYRAALQISKWCILQIMNAFTATLCISNNNILILNTQFLKFQKIVLFSSLTIVLFVGLNNFFNLFLNEVIFVTYKKRKQQLNYKRIVFIYLFLMGCMIFFLNEITLWKVPMSLIVTIFHFSYLVLINFYMCPYKNSLRIHQKSLLFLHSILLIFLVLINMINLIQKINQLILIIFGYLTTILCTFSIILTAIRLYYQYRYGQALEIKIQQEIATKLKQQQGKKEELLLKKLQNIQMAAKKRAQKELNSSYRNPYSMTNYYYQKQKQQVVDWLKTKHHLTHEQKEKYFFDKYDQKPLSWLKKHQTNQYNKKIEEHHQIIKKSRQIKLSQQYLQVRQRTLRSSPKKKTKDKFSPKKNNGKLY